MIRYFWPINVIYGIFSIFSGRLFSRSPKHRVFCSKKYFHKSKFIERFFIRKNSQKCFLCAKMFDDYESVQRFMYYCYLFRILMSSTVCLCVVVFLHCFLFFFLLNCFFVSGANVGISFTYHWLRPVVGEVNKNHFDLFIILINLI